MLIKGNPNQNPIPISIPDAPAVVSFERVISQPADGDSFVVTLPVAQANTNYAVIATLADASFDVIIKIPKATRTTTQFVCMTSAALSDGDSIDFEVRGG